jgi:hypothetical protein
LNQQGYIVYLWKLEFEDDRLVTIAVKDGKVSGFFLRQAALPAKSQLERCYP